MGELVFAVHYYRADVAILDVSSAIRKLEGPVVNFRVARDSAGMRTVILGREVENDIDRALVLLCVDSASAPPVRSELSKPWRPSPSSQPVQ